jgi:hypothetical protein
MTPDEHYLEAEKLLTQAAAGGSGADQDRLIARAHVHAILSTSAAGPQRPPGALARNDKGQPTRFVAPPQAEKNPPSGQVPTNEVIDYPGDDQR